MEYRHRVTDQVTDRLPEQLPYGVWQLLRRDGARSSLKYLVPDRNGVWHDADTNQIGSFPAGWTPASNHQRAAAEMRDTLLGQSAQPRWDAWIANWPLSPGMATAAAKHELEEEIAARLHHLEHVAHRPRLYLRISIEREPVGRVRRSPPTASEFLASHSEDWERRTLEGIVPRRVLALRAEDDLNIFENQVAARLIDLLLDYVVERREEVAQLLEQFELALDSSRESTSAFWAKARRVYSLWGHALDAEAQTEMARNTLKDLDSLCQRLRRLCESTLYRGLSERIAIGATVRQTNIFANDEHYREVLTLWLAYTGAKAREERTDDDLARYHQCACEGYEAFVLLLIARVLDQDGWTPIGEDALRRDGSGVLMQRGATRLALQWTSEGHIVASGPALARTLRFMPVLTTPDGVGQIRRVGEDSLALADEERVLLCIPDPSAEGLASGEAARVMLQGEATERACGILALSPLRLDSEERVGRVLRAELLGMRLEAYPPKISVAKAAGARLAAALPHAVEVRGDAPRLTKLVPHVAVERAISNLIDAPQKLSARGATRLAPDTAAVREAMNAAVDAIRDIVRCPVCQIMAVASLLAGARDYFSCTCPDCGANWGARVCGACTGRYGYLMPQQRGEEVPVGSAAAAERRFGRDLIADVCWMDAGGDTFICPKCMVCPNRERHAGLGCQRCRVEPVLTPAYTLW